MLFSTRHLVSTLSLLTVLSVFTISCKKGDTGPAGATGSKGTANVFYSAWVLGTNFRDSTIDNSNMHLATLPAPQVADSIVQRGAVLVYFTYGSGVFPLPHTTYAGSKASLISFIPMVNRIFITRFTLDNSNSVNLSTALQYRYIVIPGGTGNRQIDYKSMSYDQVCQALGIPE